MIEQTLEFRLPKPWTGGLFRRERIGEINFLVGPNGSGKSRFAEAMKSALPKCRLLGTDRLMFMSRSTTDLWGDHFGDGYQKGMFQRYKQSGENQNSAIDTFVILEERPDIRVRLEATLTNLFNRRIYVDWDSGNLVPKVTLGSSGESYRADKDECHGIRELLVLLTHLYNDQYHYLIVDEPELNLHPQYQSFFLQEVRKIAGNPRYGGTLKGIFLITHSPFIIDLKGLGDLSSVLSFSSEHIEPVSVGGVTGRTETRLGSLISRLNVHHKQLFFSDSPIFVEGILDAQIITAIQERRNVSITAAGSCIIDAGGCEEVTSYINLCRLLGKSAYFLYDLDSLFLGTLRQCIAEDGAVSHLLTELGIGDNFGRYCGELDRVLSDAVKAIRDTSNVEPEIASLKSYFTSLQVDGDLRDKNLQRARVALLIDLSSRREKIVNVISDPVAKNIEGRLKRILGLLKSKKILVLPGGALEHYLPSFVGDRYAFSQDAKRNAVDRESALLATGEFDDQLQIRYTALFDVIAELPAKQPVDTDTVLRTYLSDYIHQLQNLVVSQPEWGQEQLKNHFAATTSGLNKLFSIQSFERVSTAEFSAVVRVLGSDGRIVRVTHETNAGMNRFSLEVPSPQRPSIASSS